MSASKPASLRTKVLAMTVGVASLGIVSSAVTLAFRHLASMRANAQDNAVVLSAAVAEYAAGALVFDDAEGAAQILQKLRFNADVTEATLFDRDGQSFVVHGGTPGNAGKTPSVDPARPASVALDADARLVTVYQPVLRDGERVGTLRLRLSTAVLEAQLLRDMTLVLGVSLLIIGLCALLAARLQRFITNPILSLASVMKRVGEENLLDERVTPPTQDEVGTLYRGFNAMLDQIHERAAERDANESYLRALVQALPDRVLVLDEHGNEVSAVVSAQRGLQTSPEEKGSDAYLRSLSESARERVRSAIQSVIAQGTTERVEYEIEQPGLPTCIEAVFAPLSMRTVDGLRTLLVVARDVSERRVLQEKLVQAQKLEAVGQLAGGVAHDFNNLLAGIMGYAELVRSKAPGIDPVNAAAEIARIAEHAAQLTSRILGFARKDKAHSTATDVCNLVSRVAAILERTVDRRIEIRRELGEPCFIDADPAQVESAILNLGLNARDAMPNGGKLTFGTSAGPLEAPPQHSLAHLDTGPFRPGRYVQVWVSDTGDGIPEDVAPRIFEPFFTTKAVGKGSGLGLAAVATAVTAHRGVMQVVSATGKGTTFRLFFPALEHNAALLAAAPANKQRVEHAAPGAHIMVVDDERVIRETSGHLLQSFGHRVTLAASGSEAVAILRKPNDIALVVLDMVMPEMSGAETLARIRQIAPDVPVIVASGYSLLSTGETLHPDDFLQKPFSSIDLERKVREQLSRANRQRRVSSGARR